MKKVGVIKLGARIMWETDAAVGPGEAISICKALATGGAEVHVFTKILAKDTLHPSLNWHHIIDSDQADLDALDTLFIINGNVNFFGGAEDQAQILNYSIINNFKGDVIYVMCDPELPLLQIWENVSKKPWGAEYREENVNITRTDIRVLSQPFDVKEVERRWKSKKGTAPIGEVFHFPMERFPMLNSQFSLNQTPSADLMYGGTTRGGRRIPNLHKWYLNLPDDISAEIFGKIDGDDFKKHPKVGALISDGTRMPKFTGNVKYCDMLPKMNEALAHLVTGDPSYEVLDIIPQRAMECIAAGNIVFVDAAMDKSRRIHTGELSREFLYVETQAEFVDKMRFLKETPELRQKLYEEQLHSFNGRFDPIAFCQSLVNVCKP